MNRPFAAALLLTLTAFSMPQAKSADLSEYVQDTVLLPVRTAAIVSALSLTSPLRAAKGAVEMAKQVSPDPSPDTLVFEYAAVPLGLVAGALVGPFDGAESTINKAWDKPFSAESFSIEN